MSVVFNPKSAATQATWAARSKELIQATRAGDCDRHALVRMLTNALADDGSAVVPGPAFEAAVNELRKELERSR